MDKPSFHENQILGNKALTERRLSVAATFARNAGKIVRRVSMPKIYRNQTKDSKDLRVPVNLRQSSSFRVLSEKDKLIHDLMQEKVNLLAEKENIGKQMVVYRANKRSSKESDDGYMSGGDTNFQHGVKLDQSILDPIQDFEDFIAIKRMQNYSNN